MKLKTRLYFIVTLFASFCAFGQGSIVTPILNGQLQSKLDANNNGISNVASIQFNDGTVQATAGGGGNFIASTNGTGTGTALTLPTFTKPSIGGGSLWNDTTLSNIGALNFFDGSVQSTAMPSVGAAGTILMSTSSVAAWSNTVPIAHGGTGQTTASTARTALATAGLTDNNAMSGSNNFSGSVRLANTYFANGFNPGPSFVFDIPTSVGGDQDIALSGSTNGSGAGFTFDILSGQGADSSLPQSPQGLPIADTPSINGVPTGAPYTDFPGSLLLVSPQGEIDIAGNGQPHLVSAGNASSQAGRMGAPYLGGGTNIYMYALTIKDGTNVYTRPADAPKLFEWDTLGGGFYVYNTPNGFTLANGCTLTDTNGVILKANGKLNNTKVFDSADVGIVNLSSAEILAGQFVTSATGTTNGFFDVQQSGWNTDGSGGVLFQSQGTGVFFCDNTGIYSRAALDNTLILGTTGSTWKQVATHTLMMSSATNQSTGKFILNGTSTVAVGNTTVSASCTIVCWESTPGGTASGTVIPISQTAGTGFSVKSIALDTSTVSYVIVQNPF